MPPWRFHRLDGRHLDSEALPVLDEQHQLGSPLLTLYNPSMNTRVHVIGVAHCSARSNDDVAAVIRRTRPCAVLLELCNERRCRQAHRVTSHAAGGRGILASTWPPTPLPELNTDTLASQWRLLINPLFWAVELPSLGLAALAGSGMGHEQAVAFREGAQQGAMVLLVDRRQGVTMGRIMGGAIDVVFDRRAWSLAFTLMRKLWNAQSTDSDNQSVVEDMQHLKSLSKRGSELSDQEISAARKLTCRVVETMVDSPGHAIESMLVSPWCAVPVVHECCSTGQGWALGALTGDKPDSTRARSLAGAQVVDPWAGELSQCCVQLLACHMFDEARHRSSCSFRCV